MSLALYAITALLVAWLAHRFIAPISRRAALVLFLLPFCFVGKALLTDGVYAPVDLPYATEPLKAMMPEVGLEKLHNGVISDLYAQMIPWRKAVQYAYAHGQWPLWNPFILSGDLLAASAQPAVYSPFTLIALLLPVAKGLTFSAAITFFLAGLGAFLFARELGCCERSSLFAAAGWMFSKALAFFVLWSVGGTWALFPLVLLATRRCVRAPSFRSAVLLAIMLILLIFAGHPESVLHVVFVGGLYGLFELARARRMPLRAIGVAAAAGVAALLVTAIYLLPVFDAAPQTMEYQFRTGDWAHMSHGGTRWETSARLLTDLLPWLHGHAWKWHEVNWLPPDSAAAGCLILGLALFAIWRIRTAETWFFAAIALFGFLARAAWKPLSDLLQTLPMFDIAINERFSFAAAFALVILATLAVERWDQTRERSAGVTLAATLVALLIANHLVMNAHIVSPDGSGWGRHAFAGETVCLGLAALLALVRPPVRMAVPLLIAILVVSRFAADGDVYPTLPSRVAYPPVPILVPAQKTTTPFRIVALYYGFTPGTSTLYELEDVRGYEALTFERYFETYRLWCIHQPVWYNRVDDATAPFLSFLNVRYAIASQDMKTPPPGWHFVAQQPGSVLIENEHMIERAFIPRHVTVNRPDGDALNEMAEQKDFRERAWIKAPLPTQEFANGSGTLMLMRRGSGFHIKADMASNGWVVLSEPAWRGWRVYLDGKRVNWYFANNAFLGFWVPRGRHEVRVAYLPDSFVTGRAISFGSVALMAAIIVLLRRRHRIL